MTDQRRRAGWAVVAAAVASAVTMLVLDLAWLGLVARGLYDAQLGPLKRAAVYWPAAALFYGMYLGAVLGHGVIAAPNNASALRRGGALGFVAYATYELTNWAVLKDWPALLVPIDVAWGVVLTAVVALVGKLVHARVRGLG